MQLENEHKELGRVFEAGNLIVKSIHVKIEGVCGAPAELLVVAPKAEDRYPVAIFCHGYCTHTTWYTQLLHHISSHGYILVAPQFYECLVICMKDEIKTAANVTNWLEARGLESCLPQKVIPDLSKAALMGHSRGGKIAFGLALRHHPTSLTFKALLGLDPVVGPAPPAWVEPNIFSYIPRSFDMSIPIAVIGTGLSNQSKGFFIPPLAGDGYNHSEFFNESKPPCCYFLAKDYGHCDVLDDRNLGWASLVCRSGEGCKDKMRRGVGGVVVSFLDAYLGGECNTLQGIVDKPHLAPIAFDPVIYVKE